MESLYKDIILQITSFLKIKDVICFTLVSKRIYVLFDNNYWTERLYKDLGISSKDNTESKNMYAINYIKHICTYKNDNLKILVKNATVISKNDMGLIYLRDGKIYHQPSYFYKYGDEQLLSEHHIKQMVITDRCDYYSFVDGDGKLFCGKINKYSKQIRNPLYKYFDNCTFLSCLHINSVYQLFEPWSNHAVYFLTELPWYITIINNKPIIFSPEKYTINLDVSISEPIISIKQIFGRKNLILVTTNKNSYIYDLRYYFNNIEEIEYKTKILTPILLHTINKKIFILTRNSHRIIDLKTNFKMRSVTQIIDLKISLLNGTIFTDTTVVYYQNDKGEIFIIEKLQNIYSIHNSSILSISAWTLQQLSK